MLDDSSFSHSHDSHGVHLLQDSFWNFERHPCFLAIQLEVQLKNGGDHFPAILLPERQDLGQMTNLK